MTDGDGGAFPLLQSGPISGRLYSMDARHLTPSQAEKVYVKLRPAFEYLAALQSRMDERNWERGDRLYLEIKAARDTMQLLCADLHAVATRAYTPKGKQR